MIFLKVNNLKMLHKKMFFFDSQQNGFSAVCIPTCVFKYEFAENYDPHTLQENGFMPEFVCMKFF